ncbi:MAG: chromate efflux transporter [Alphaproteobacteria bacterium]|nr:chromate efflux transporter [Alphaproteobacteria bacterium]
MTRSATSRRARPLPAERSAASVFLAFLRLGLTSFGGPVAHLGYFRAEFVARRGWLDEAAYADLVALCQFLPGPASSQVGIAIGLTRAGLGGALAAWLGFTLPSATALILFGYGIARWHVLLDAGWLHGLKIAAVAVVAQAVWGMARGLAPDRPRMTLAIAAACLVLAAPGSGGQIVVLLAGGIAGLLFPRSPLPPADAPSSLRIGRGHAVAALGSFCALLLVLPLLVHMIPDHGLALIASFYRTGSLVFGGGHVVLPLLQAEIVPRGWTDNATFLAGYGAAQAVPGPLFTFAAYLGTVMQPAPTGWVGGLICLIAIFLPSFFLVVGTLPFWHELRRSKRVQASLRGINAAVVGLLLAALYQPVWTSSIAAPADFALALAAFLLLVFWRAPPWLVVLGAALACAVMAAL